jgi:hypothetical protein
MTTINNSLSFGENLLITLTSANSYSYTNVLLPEIRGKTFVRLLANFNCFVKLNFITANAYVYDATNPTVLNFAKEAYVGKQEIWYKCDPRISQVTATLDTTLTPLINGETVTIVCEFIDFTPKDLLEDV